MESIEESTLKLDSDFEKTVEDMKPHIFSLPLKSGKCINIVLAHPYFVLSLCILNSDVVLNLFLPLSIYIYIITERNITPQDIRYKSKALSWCSTISIFWQRGAFVRNVLIRRNKIVLQLTALRIYIWVREVLVGFKDVAIQPSGASFSTTFLNNCGRGEGLGTTTCPKTMVGVCKGMHHVIYLRSNKASFYVC